MGREAKVADFRDCLAGTAVAPVASMMRITRMSGTDGVARLAIEGRVAGAAVSELAASCEAYLAVRHPLTLDLSAVTFVDPAGVGLLRGVAERGAVVLGCSPFLSALLGERLEGY